MLADRSKDYALQKLKPSTLSWTLHILDTSSLMKQPLDTKLLITAARRRARLDNFGDETFREPLRRLLACCESEARLNTKTSCKGIVP
jgi:hypothetical protein